MQFRILGPLEALEGADPLPLGGRKPRALLARLLLDANRTVSVDRLIDDLWGECAPESAVKMVHIYVSQLRKVLPPDTLRTRPPGYVLEADPEAIDAVRFGRLRGEGRAAMAAGDAHVAAERLREALALWHGPALAEFSEPFAELERAHLEELHLTCLEERIEADLALSRHPDLVGELEALIVRHPLRERLRGQLMLALYRSGRHAEALAAYQSFRRRLAEELGLEPSAGLRALEQSILDQDHELAAASGPAAAPARGTAARPGRPVGRDDELDALERALAAAAEGARRTVFVTGDPGAGKTTVVEALLAAAEEQAPAAGLGQCLDHRGPGEPYLPVLDALARMARGPHGDRLAGVLADRAPTWLPHLPALVAPEQLASAEERARGATRERMLREMIEALEALAADVPVVLVLEDLHWSDESTLALLAALARRREPARLLVVGTARPSPDGAHGVAALVRELTLHAACEEIVLSRLSDAEVAEYLAGRFPGAELPPSLPGMLRERAGGNPLYLARLADHWAADGLVVEQPGGWRLAAGLDGLVLGIPRDLRASIEDQLAALDQDAREVLDAASVAGIEFPVPAVAAALHRPVEAVEATCAALGRGRPLLEPRGDAAWPDGSVTARYGFIHDVHREVLYDLLLPPRRASLHRRIGRWLEHAAGAELGAWACELAVHFATGQDRERAIRFLRRAAEQAFARNAHGEGITSLRVALDAAAALPESPGRARAQVELLSLLGQALVATGGWSAADAEEALLAARALARDLADNEPLVSVLLALATLYEVRGEYGRSAAIADECLRILPGGEHGRRLESLELLACNLFHQGAFARALEQADQGAELAETGRVEGHYSTFPATLGDNAGVACHDWAGLSLWYLGRPDEALARARRALELAEDPSRAYSLATARAQLAVIHQCRAEPAATLRWANATIESAGPLGYTYRSAMGRVLRGWALATLGEVEDGVAELECGLEASRATGAHMDDPHYLGLLADARRRAGDARGGLAAVAEGFAVSERERTLYYAPELHRLRAALLLDSGGSPAEAEQCLREALSAARRQGSPALELRAATALGRLWMEEGRAAEARTLVRPVHDRFEEGLLTPDLLDAAALLEGSAAPAAGFERRSLTVVAWELVGVAALAERLEPERLLAVMGASRDAGRRAVEALGGHAAHVWEAGGVAYFGFPDRHDDDPVRAVGAALAIRDALATVEGEQVSARAAVHSGEVVVGLPAAGAGAEPTLAPGEVVTTAGRLVPAAAPDCVIVTAATQALLRGAFDCRPLGPEAGHADRYEVVGPAAGHDDAGERTAGAA